MTKTELKTNFFGFFTGTTASARFLRVLFPLIVLAILIQGFLDEMIIRALGINKVWFIILLSLTFSTIAAGIVVQLSRKIFHQADVAEIERRQSELILRESEARFRDLTENTSDWIWEVDAQLRYVYANPRVKELLGYEPGETIGKTPFDFMPVLEAERLRNDFVEMVKAPEPFRNLENINLHKDGTIRVLETSGVPIFDAEGKFKGFRGIDRDITLRKRAEVEREKLINDLQAAFADIKTLSGLIPICSSCKKIRDDKGYWNILEAYLVKHSEAKFTHGICPECAKKLYPNH
jgi:PAS domain S-box-containing protein